MDVQITLNVNTPKSVQIPHMLRVLPLLHVHWTSKHSDLHRFTTNQRTRSKSWCTHKKRNELTYHAGLAKSKLQCAGPSRKLQQMGVLGRFWSAFSKIDSFDIVQPLKSL